jgi:putative FmdB family regulatory protein
MPLYVFLCEECGNEVEKFLAVSKRARPGKCKSCGGKLVRDFVAEKMTTQDYHAESIALGYSEGTREARIKQDMENGILADDYGRTGPIFKNRRKHARYLEAYGIDGTSTEY